MTSGFDAAEFIAGFTAEAEEHLATARRGLLELDEAAKEERASPRVVRELFRALHTIKGLSAMVGVEPIVELSHAMEAVLRTADRSGGHLSSEAVDRLVQGARAIEERVSALSREEPVAPAPQDLLEALADLEPGEDEHEGPPQLAVPPELEGKLGASEHEQIAQGVAAGQRLVRLDFAPQTALAEQGVNITTVRERVSEAGEIVKVVPRSLPASDAAPNGLVFTLLLLTGQSGEAIAIAAGLPKDAAVELAGPRPAAPQPRRSLELAEDVAPVEEAPPEAARRGFVRVDVRRLDDALDKLSILVVSRFRLERALRELAQRGVDVRELEMLLNEHGRRLRDLRGAVMQARMVPVAEVLERVPLIVRGLSRATGKEIRLHLDTGRAELDKAVAERVFPAIVHLVRNAVDHAIEPAEERARLGKPREGHVEVTCHERSSRYLEITVRDDGRGIDAEQVAAKAGVPVPKSDAALLELITTPGLSTLAQPTRTSGRGVGMDVVKRVAVDELGGELRLFTRPGVGTAFTLQIPLSLTIIDAITVQCGAQPFVVPVSMVEEILEVDRARLCRGPELGQAPVAGVFERRGEPLPLVELDAVFGLTAPRPAPDARAKALLVRRNGEGCAFAVERVLTQQEVVVRPLEDPLVRVPGVTGSTDLGDGRPTLVLDLVALSATLAGPSREATP